VRRYLAVLALVCSTTFLGASRPAPQRPAAFPVPSPSPTVAPLTLPALVIYPFTVNGDADKKAGAKLAALFVAQIQNAGGVLVKPLPAKPVVRTDYLTSAIRSGADYYVSGYLTPIGEQVALVEQIVSTSSGAIIWSNTAQLLTYGDASSQADDIRKAILGHAGRIQAQYRQQQALSTPTPGPAHGTSASIGSILGILHRDRGRPAPKPSLAPDQKPARGILVIQLGGAPETARIAATTTLARSLERIFRVTRSAVVTRDAGRDARTVCGAQTNVTIAGGDVAQERVRTFPPRTVDVFTMRVYRCDGSILFSSTQRASSFGDAIDNAVAAFVAAHPGNG